MIWTMAVMLVITYFGSKFLLEELEKYANYDTLTHLLNRRSMDNYMQEAYRQATTGKSSFCLLMADIDDFKKVNDTYGHDCGDEVLKYVAQTISTGVKKNDSVFRWGGEEICILLNADTKLYWGKQHGKNRVVSILPEEPKPPKIEKKMDMIERYSKRQEG